MRGRYWTEAEIDTLRAWLAEGKGLAEIVRLTGRGKSEVAGILHRLKEADAAEYERMMEANRRRRHEAWNGRFEDVDDETLRRELGRIGRGRVSEPVVRTMGGVASW